jgi:hypothetical protein
MMVIDNLHRNYCRCCIYQTDATASTTDHGDNDRTVVSYAAKQFYEGAVPLAVYKAACQVSVIYMYKVFS